LVSGGAGLALAQNIDVCVRLSVLYRPVSASKNAECTTAHFWKCGAAEKKKE
jgi:hypothetical protein